MEDPKSICEGLREYAKRRDSGKEAWIEDVSLNKGLECGCEYCDLACKLVGGIEVEKNKGRNRDASASNVELTLVPEVVKNAEQRPHQMLYTRADESGISFSMDRTVHSKELFVLDRSDDPLFPVAPSISGDTGSDKAFFTAAKWFEDCVMEHKLLCPPLVRSSEESKLPLRVIDVGTLDSQKVRLVETLDKVGYWACLSHCWGGEQPLKTTRNPDTLTQHLVAIEWDKMPKTFQEAIIVARKFGIEFLWVDSLCIIQDDPHDWRTQSAEMAYIYQQSVLTIAASASSGPHQGLFRHADSANLDGSVADALGLVKLDKVRSRKPIIHNSAELPLLQRCWAHQERLLSPRTLHFSQNELVWECMQRTQCECGGIQEGHRLLRPTWPAPKNYLHPKSLLLDDWMLRRGPSAWHDLVSDYSRMGLTHADDIFPAISGLAKSVSKATGWKYVAGIWKENMILDLMWVAKKPEKLSRCKPWRAPTFSWASIIVSSSEDIGKAWISYRYVDALQQGLAARHKWETYFYATLVEASCTPCGDDPTGQLEAAYVTLKGTLVRATLKRSTSEYKDWQIAAVGMEPEDQHNFYMDFDLAGDAIHGPKENDEVFCLKLASSKKNIKYADDEFVAWLVLRKVLTGTASSCEQKGPRFERIGFLESRNDEARIDEKSEPSAINRDVLVTIM